MKSISIFFIASASYYDRLISIIGNTCSSLLSYNFSIIACEKGHQYNYFFNHATAQRWCSMLPSIYEGLRDNVQLITEASSLPSPATFSSSSSETWPQWLQPRELTFGDLSVLSKHHQALNCFLNTTDDFALICEDDVIFSQHSLHSIHKLAQGLTFDFIDIAGGDGLVTHKVDFVVDDRISLELKNNYATRTACCYLVSRRYAEYLVKVLSHPVFPIDWSMAYAFSLFPSKPLVYWLCNPLAEHGSSVGKVTSWRVTK